MMKKEDKEKIDNIIKNDEQIDRNYLEFKEEIRKQIKGGKKQCQEA